MVNVVNGAPGGMTESGASFLVECFHEHNWQYFCIKDGKRSRPSVCLRASYRSVAMRVNRRVLESGIARASVLFSQWNSPLSGEKKAAGGSVCIR